MNRKTFGIDALWAVVAALFVGFASLYLYYRGGGAVVVQGPFYGSDVFRVRENLLHPLSPSKSYFRLSVHPLYGLICVAAQMVQKITHLSEYRIYALMAFIYGALTGALLYICVRIWGGGRVLAAATILFYCSTAGFIYWCSVTETHPWGGLTVLGVVAMARWRPKRVDTALLWQAIAFATAFSILVTHAMLWVFNRLPFDAGSVRAGIARLRGDRTILRMTVELLAGLGIVLLGYTLARKALHGAEMGQLLYFSSEKQFISSNDLAPFNGFNILGLVGPRLDYGTSISVFINMAFGLLCCATVFRVPPKLRFLPLFLLFALVFHSFFVRFQSFLFAIEYTAAGVLVLGLAGEKLLGRWAVAVLVAASIVMGAINLRGFDTAVDMALHGQGSVQPKSALSKWGKSQ